MLKKILIFLLLIILQASGKDSSDYFFPLKESKNLTSVFGDHRNFHFHSGIDISTFGKTGYKVFACQSGWVFRIYCSFWGYGKGLYLKLDDGRYAVYGHLSKFAPKIEKLIREKQIQNKSYKLNLFLEENRIRVERGEMVGYSGEAGAGAPHLHFELRDSQNRPLNPLTHGISVPDRNSPVFRKLLIKPEDKNSCVDGENKTKIYDFAYDQKKNTYYLKQTPTIWGKVGLEVCCYDRMNKKYFGIHNLEAYLDGELFFSVQYDTIDFESSWMVELDRDFELRKKRNLNFYKLFVESGNSLNLYQTKSPRDGLINTSQVFESQGHPEHKIEILAYDASGNSRGAEFFLLFNRRPEILSLVNSESDYGTKVEGILKDDSNIKFITFEQSPVENIDWLKKEFVHPKILTSLSDSLANYSFMWKSEDKDPYLVKIQAEDGDGLKSDYRYLLINGESVENQNPQDMTDFDFKHSYKDGYLNVDLSFNKILQKEPEVKIKNGLFNFDPISFVQKDEKSYSATFLMTETKSEGILLLIDGMTIYKDMISLTRPVPLALVVPDGGGKAFSLDSMASIRISPGLVYKSINLEIEKKDPPQKIKHKVIGSLYSFEPEDIPFSGYADISLFYDEEDTNPDKLAIYELNRDKWRFVGKEKDQLIKKVSGKVRYLSEYALLEDSNPPEIRILYPQNGKSTRRRKPNIKVKIKDDLSGFGSEEDIEVTLDGEWMIPEYDPEKTILITTPNNNLSYGWHNLKIRARDRMGNLNVVEGRFKVIK